MMGVQLRTRINGRDYVLEIEAQESLAEVLRDRLHLTGTKVSCDVQVCGACTVLLDGLPVSACTLLAYEARGRDVFTVEGLVGPTGALHPLQQAFIEENALQCGFCTPGMLLAAKSLLEYQPNATDAEIVEYMDGNICRCTGYRPILAAIRRAKSTLNTSGDLDPTSSASSQMDRHHASAPPHGDVSARQNVPTSGPADDTESGSAE